LKKKKKRNYRYPLSSFWYSIFENYISF